MLVFEILTTVVMVTLYSWLSLDLGPAMRFFYSYVCLLPPLVLFHNAKLYSPVSKHICLIYVTFDCKYTFLQSSIAVDDIPF